MGSVRDGEPLPGICKTLTWEGKTYRLYVLQLENASISFFVEGGTIRMGTLAFSTPPTDLLPATSSLLLGHRNASLARLLAEFLAVRLRCLSLASVHCEGEADVGTGTALMELARAALTATGGLQSSGRGGSH